MPHMQGTRGVGAHEFDLYLFTGPEGAVPVRFFPRMDFIQHPDPSPRVDITVDEAGTGDLHPFEGVGMRAQCISDNLGHFAGRPLGGRSHDHGGIGRKITELLIGWKTYPEIRSRSRRQAPLLHEVRYRFVHQRRYCFLHAVPRPFGLLIIDPVHTHIACLCPVFLSKIHTIF